MTTNPTKIERLELRSRLDGGIYQSDQDAWAGRDLTGEPTKAVLAGLLDIRDYRRLYLAGCYGGIGSGGTDVVLIAHSDEWIIEPYDRDGCDRIDDAELGEEPRQVSEASAFALMPEEGGLGELAQTITGLRGQVWDGNNHVDYHPSRSWDYLSGDDQWTELGHSRVQFDENGALVDTQIDDGWVILDEYWGTLGNEPWTYHHDGHEDLERALGEAAIECSVDLVSDDDLMVLVRTQDEKRAIALCEENWGDGTLPD